MSQDTFGYKRCERLLRAKRIVYQGLESVYSNLAAAQFFSQHPEAGFSHVKTFNAAARAVDGDASDYAALPTENSTVGSVADSYDTLAKREVSVIGECLLPVRHALLACGDAALADIRTACSYPQGTKQCTPFFERHLEIEAVAVSNTAIVAQLVQMMGKSSVAAITSAYAGRIYGLEVLIPTPNYHAENTTRLLTVGREKLYLRDTKIVSLMMRTRREAGVLYHVLGALYAEDINLFRLVARPIPGVSWVYRFLLDFSGSLEEAAAQRAFRGVERLSMSLRILGCFQEKLWC